MLYRGLRLGQLVTVLPSVTRHCVPSECVGKVAKIMSAGAKHDQSEFSSIVFRLVDTSVSPHNWCCNSCDVVEYNYIGKQLEFSFMME